MKLAAGGPRLWLACRSGYSDSLVDLARADARIELVDVAEVLGR